MNCFWQNPEKICSILTFRLLLFIHTFRYDRQSTYPWKCTCNSTRDAGGCVRGTKYEWQLTTPAVSCGHHLCLTYINEWNGKNNIINVILYFSVFLGLLHCISRYVGISPLKEMLKELFTGNLGINFSYIYDNHLTRICVGRCRLQNVDRFVPDSMCEKAVHWLHISLSLTCHQGCWCAVVLDGILDDVICDDDVCTQVMFVQ